MFWLCATLYYTSISYWHWEVLLLLLMLNEEENVCKEEKPDTTRLQGNEIHFVWHEKKTPFSTYSKNKSTKKERNKWKRNEKNRRIKYTDKAERRTRKKRNRFLIFSHFILLNVRFDLLFFSINRNSMHTRNYTVFQSQTSIQTIVCICVSIRLICRGSSLLNKKEKKNSKRIKQKQHQQQ